MENHPPTNNETAEESPELAMARENIAARQAALARAAVEATVHNSAAAYLADFRARMNPETAMELPPQSE